jgi:hypothetical protein
MPRICLSESELLKATAGSWQGDGTGTAWERHGMCELAAAVQRRHVGDLPAFGVFLLPRGVPGSLLSKACQSQMQMASVKQTRSVMDEEKLIILVQGHECLCNLQHNDCDNNLVKDNCWKEIARELQGSGRVAAGERHGMSKSVFNTAGERQRTAWERHGMCESALRVAV